MNIDKLDEMTNEAKRLIERGLAGEAANLLYEAAKYVLYEGILRSDVTKLDYDIWFDPSGPRNLTLKHHYPRVKIRTNEGHKKHDYPVYINNDNSLIVVNENRIKGGCTKEKQFILDNIDLIKIYADPKYSNVFDTADFIQAFTKYLKGVYKTKQEMIDFLFKDNEEMRPIL